MVEGRGWKLKIHKQTSSSGPSFAPPPGNSCFWRTTCVPVPAFGGFGNSVFEDFGPSDFQAGEMWRSEGILLRVHRFGPLGIVLRKIHVNRLCVRVHELCPGGRRVKAARRPADLLKVHPPVPHRTAGAPARNPPLARAHWPGDSNRHRPAPRDPQTLAWRQCRASRALPPASRC
jgi:hypothetical protein